MTPQQLTALNLDKTGLLEEVLRKNFSHNPDDLLGELQFSFLAFLMGQSLEGTSLLLFFLLFSESCIKKYQLRAEVPLLHLLASDAYDRVLVEDRFSSSPCCFARSALLRMVKHRCPRECLRI